MKTTCRRIAITPVAIALLLAQEMAAQQPPSAMELNRAGRFVEAVAAAQREIDSPGVGLIQRCENMAMLIYALSGLGRLDDIRTQSVSFRKECSSIAADHWIYRETTAPLAKAGLAPLGSATLPERLSRDDDWMVGDPVALGLDTIVLRLHRELCERSAADACVVVRRGQIVDEWYGPLYEEPMMAMSSTKSVTSLLVGMLATDGRLAIDDPVARFIPEWRAGSSGGVSIRHLLSMTSGLAANSATTDVGTVSDKLALVFGDTLVARPGAAWAYSNNGVFLLSPIIARAAGEPVSVFARRRLFEPLGMQRSQMHVHPREPVEQAWTHADMETTPRDLARIGQLMLQGGRWQGRQVVPEDWVNAVVKTSQRWAPYGLLWWLDVPDGFAARGYLDTNVYVLPKQDLVVVRMQGQPKPGATPYNSRALALFSRMVR